MGWLSAPALVVPFVVLVALGCAGPEPRVPDHLFLRAGVDPVEEAAEVERALTAAGFEVLVRLGGAGYRALSLRHPDGRTAVRVTTGRGVALAIDAPARPGAPRAAVWLPTDVPTARDLDGDGMHELVVAVRTHGREAACLGLVRVRVEGTAHEVPLAPGTVRSGSCVEAFRDVGGDARPEALVVEHHPGLLPGAPPRVSVPLAGRAGRWRRAPVRAYAPFFDRQRDARAGEAGEARRRGQVDRALRLGVELAALARHRGRPRAAQLRAFDDAVRGLVVSQAQAQRMDCIRAHIGGGWASGTATCYTPDSHERQGSQR